MKHLLIVLSACVVLFSACTHDAGMAIGGKGGAAVLNIYPQHHGIAYNLDSCMVYVKYNTLDAPANGEYDDSVMCLMANSMVSCSFSGLRNGNYYFYGRGYDHSISQRVKGGLPYKVTQQDSQIFSLPVSEE